MSCRNADHACAGLQAVLTPIRAASGRYVVRALALCALFAVATAFAYGATDSLSRFMQLQEQIRAAHHRGDSREVLARSLELARLLHDSGPATEQVALAYAKLGDREQALQWLRDFVAMGQSDDALPGRPQWKSVRSSPRFARILAAMRGNESPIDRATVVSRLREARLLPEDIDYDAGTRSFLVTSVIDREIVRIALHGAKDTFFHSPDDWPMLAVKIDPRRRIVWATEVAITGFASAPRNDWGRSALLCLRLTDGALLRKIEAPHTELGDMALMPNGDLIVSDGENGGVYRAHAGCTDAGLRRVDSGQFISPQTPAPLSDGRHVFVPDYVRGVALLDVQTGRARWLDGSRRHAMQGIDGMYLISRGLLCIQNGATPERLVLFRLDDRLRVVSEEIIARSSPTLGVPTHGVVVNGEFYYIANSGWNWLDDAGAVKSGATITPALIEKISTADL